MQPLAVYVHIPFCAKKCAYCDFLSFPPDAFAEGKETVQRRYFDALLREIDLAAGEMPLRERAVQSIYFGGGTPTYADSRDIKAVLQRLRQRFFVLPDAEISLECNPGATTAEELGALRDAGVNRLSIGAQSFLDEELRLLGRIHSAEDARECFAAARDAGFSNISLDLMAALPGQTQDALLFNVKSAMSLAPEHLSLYSLIIEPGTPFFERYAGEVQDPHFDRPVYRTSDNATAGKDGLPEVGDDDGRHLPGEEEERAMLHAAWSVLEENGYFRYEISNFTRTAAAGMDAGACGKRQAQDYRCRQNLVYWERGEYLGLGLGSASLIAETRFSNTRKLYAYLEAFVTDDPLRAIREDTEHLGEASRMEEFMFLGLRLREGVEESRFADAFSVRIDEVYGETLDRLAASGLLLRRDGRVFLTNTGTDLANTAMAEFLLS
ncbi:MAG: coproporphyrinogen III oxidase family protein [Lachnospiraceae bacterium]|nr:coproporphyrinogen III oxidase family protein [Lachnospiraceae bacterium]